MPANFMTALLVNGWSMLRYDGILRNAPRNLSHIFRDLKAGHYLMRGDTILVNDRNEYMRFSDVLRPLDYEIAWYSAVLLELITSRWIFLEKTGGIVSSVPAASSEHNFDRLLRSKKEGFFAYNADTKQLYNQEPYPYVQNLLGDMCVGTSYELEEGAELIHMSLPEIVLLVQDIREKLDLLDFNISNLI